MCRNPQIKKRESNKAYFKGTKQGAFTNTYPCGKCPQCLKAKIYSWLFRLDKELERSINPLFVTLTYNDENLRKHEYINTTTGEITETPTLHKKDLQDFFKRLRKAQNKAYPNANPIKYYACGEYGTKRGRPHYHIIMFNIMDVNLIQSNWGKGFSLSLPLTNGGTAYVLKYMSKVPIRNLKKNLNSHSCLREWEIII